MIGLYWAAIEKSTGEILGRFHSLPREDGRPGDVELGHRLCRAAFSGSRTT